MNEQMTREELRAIIESTGLNTETFSVLIVKRCSETVRRWLCGTYDIPYMMGVAIRSEATEWLSDQVRAQRERG